jgi:hypothetical protein
MQIFQDKYKENSAQFSEQKLPDQASYISVFVGEKSFQTQLSKTDVLTFIDHTEFNV